MRIGIWHNVKLFFYIDTTRQFTIVTISNDIRETFIEFTNGYQKKKKKWNQFENIFEYSLSSLYKGTSLRATIVFQSPIVLIDDLIKPRTEIPGIPRIIDLIIYVPRCTVLNFKMNLLKVSSSL